MPNLFSKLYDADVTDIRILLDFFNQGRGGHTVEIEDCEGLPAGIVPAEAHACDIDVMLAHEGSKLADDARPVLVVHEKEHTFGYDFHRLAVQPDDAG